MADQGKEFQGLIVSKGAGCRTKGLCLYLTYLVEMMRVGLGQRNLHFMSPRTKSSPIYHSFGWLMQQCLDALLAALSLHSS